MSADGMCTCLLISSPVWR